MGNYCCIPFFVKKVKEYKSFLKGRKKKGRNKRSTLDNDIFANDEDLLNDPEIGEILQNDNGFDEELTDEEIDDFIKQI